MTEPVSSNSAAVPQVSMESMLEEELTAIRAKGLYRKLRLLTPGQNAKANYEGREVTLFCGNDYLGLSRHPRVLQAAKKALEAHGLGSGAARLISGTTDFHVQLEAALARLKNKPRALLYSAGYLANVGVLSAIANERDLIVMDKLCHSSLIDGAKLSGANFRVFPHKQYEKCSEIFEKIGSSYRKKILVSDTVFSMDGDLADFQELARIKRKYDCVLILDDAHGTGVLGTNGGGALEDEHLEESADIVIGTLSKALGCFGGFAVASEAIIEYLINTSRTFIFATSLPAPVCAGALEAIRILADEPEIRFRLWKNVQKVHQAIQAAGFEPGPIRSPIFPVPVGGEKEAVDAFDRLLEQGLFVPAVRYPTVPKGKARLRVTVSAVHSEEDIGRLQDALKALPRTSGLSGEIS